MTKNNNNQPLIRIYSSKKRNKFYNDLDAVSWHEIYNHDNVNTAYYKFIDIVTNLYDENFPLAWLLRKRAKDKKWITTGLKVSSRRKNKLYKKWMLSRSNVDLIKYKEYKKTFDKVAKEAEVLYYKELFDNKTNTIKQIWRNINTLYAFQKSRMTAESIKSLTVNNTELVYPSEICEAFNSYFCSIEQKLVEMIPTRDDANGFRSYMDKPIVNSIYCDSTDRDELLKLIIELNPNKSCGLMAYTVK